MGRKVFCCLLLAGLLLACRTSETKTPAGLVFDWENGLTEKGPLTPTYIEYIPLETKDDCLIGSINKIIYKNKTYFILDDERKQIFLFGDKGEHFFTLDKTGKGPNEYMSIWDFDIDEDGNIYVLSLYSDEIVKYFAPSYDRAERFPLEMNAREFAIDASGQIWLAEVSSQEGSIILGRYEQGKITPVLKDTMGLKDRSLHYKQQSFYKLPDGLMFSSRYSPYVYKLENGEAQKVFRFESKKMITEDELKSESDKVITTIPNDRWEFGLATLNELGDSLYGRFWSMGSEFSAFKCDRITGKGSRYTGITKDLPGMGDFYTHADDYIVSPTAATNIIYSLRLLDGMSEEGIARLKAVAERIDEESNPVLIKFRY